MTKSREELVAEHGELHILRCEMLMARDWGDIPEHNRLVRKYNALLDVEKREPAVLKPPQ